MADRVKKREKKPEKNAVFLIFQILLYALALLLVLAFFSGTGVFIYEG